MKERFEGRKIIDYPSPTDHAFLMAAVEEFAMRYGNLEITMLGQSILGRKIPILRLGRGQYTKRTTLMEMVRLMGICVQ